MSDTHNGPWRPPAVDLVAGALLALALAATALGLWRPEQAQARQSAQLRARIERIDRATQLDETRLMALQRDARTLTDALEGTLADAPTEAQFNSILARVVALAADSGLEVQEVRPQRLQPYREYVAGGLAVQADGSLTSLIRFLDLMAERHPYHTVRDLTVTRKPAEAKHSCRIALDLQIYLLPE